MTSETAGHDASETKRRSGPFGFFGEVRAEARKVTWATRQEVTVSTIMVLVMVVLASVFFFLVDGLLRIAMGFLLGLN